MNTKVEEALDVWQAGDLGHKELCYRKWDVDNHLAQQDATIARLTAALATIRASTFRNATTLRGMADYTLTQEQVK